MFEIELKRFEACNKGRLNQMCSFYQMPVALKLLSFGSHAPECYKRTGTGKHMQSVPKQNIFSLGVNHQWDQGELVVEQPPYLFKYIYSNIFKNIFYS